MDRAVVASARPSQATVARRARTIAISTPNGKCRAGSPIPFSKLKGWHRVTITADQCPRITKEWLAGT